MLWCKRCQSEIPSDIPDGKHFCNGVENDDETVIYELTNWKLKNGRKQLVAS